MGFKGTKNLQSGNLQALGQPILDLGNHSGSLEPGSLEALGQPISDPGTLSLDCLGI